MDIKLSMEWLSGSIKTSAEQDASTSAEALPSSMLSSELLSESIPESGEVSGCGRYAMTFLGWMCRKEVFIMMLPMSAGTLSEIPWILNLEAMTFDVTSARCLDKSV